MPARTFVLGSSAPRGRGAGTVLSILFHVLIVLLLLIPLRADFARVLDQGQAGPGPGGGGGGGGGRRMAYISLPAPQAVPPVQVTVAPPVEIPPPVVVTPPVAVPVTIPPPVADAPVAAATPVAAAADSGSGAGPGQGGGTGGGRDGGIGPGTGPGTGPGAGGGEGGKGRAPQSVHLIIPPDDAPKELRGVDIQVTFWIDALGKVARVSFDPPVNDRGYARKLTEAMRNYRFRPALAPDGTPIAATYVQTVTIF